MARLIVRRSKTDQSHKLPSVVWVVSFGIFLLGTTEFMIAGLLPQLADDLQVTESRAGLLVSAFAIGMVVGAPLMALATLRLPRRTTLVAALIVFSAGHVVAALSSSFAVVLAMRVVTAFATGAYWAIGAVVITGVVAETQRARALGVLVGGLTLANVAGVPLGTYVGDVTGWRGPFWALAVLALLVAVVVAKVVPGGTDATTTSLRGEFRALRSGRLWTVLGFTALAQTGVFATFSYVSSLLTEHAGVSDGAVPLVLVLFGLGALTGSTLGGRFGDARPFTTLIVSVAVTVATLVLLGTGPSATAYTLALLFVLGTSAFTLPPVVVTLALNYAAGAPTIASSLTTSAFNVGNTVGPALGGIALDSALGARGPSLVGAIPAVAGLLVIIGLAVAVGNRRQASEDRETEAPEPEQAEELLTPRRG